MLEGTPAQAPVTVVAPVVRVFGAREAHKAGSPPGAPGVVPQTGRVYPPDG